MGKTVRNDYVEKVFDILIIICGLLLLTGGNVMVFGRVFRLSVPWAEELMRNVFVWMLFFGAAFESKRGLVAVTIIDDVLISKKKAGMYKTVIVIQTIAFLAFAILSGYYAYVQAMDQFSKNVTSLTLKYPTGIFTGLVAIAFTLMTFYQGYLLVKRIRTPKDDMLSAALAAREEAEHAMPEETE